MIRLRCAITRQIRTNSDIVVCPMPQFLRKTTAFGRCSVTALTSGFRSRRESPGTGCQAAPEHRTALAFPRMPPSSEQLQNGSIIGTENMNVSKMLDFVRRQENGRHFSQPFHPYAVSSRLRMAVSDLKTAPRKTPKHFWQFKTLALS